jgi:DNA polymerase I-like protein with 3'-5' exonuclease and polymerase domains
LIGAFLINALVRAQNLTDLATADLRFDGAPLEDLPPEDFITRAPEFIAIIHKLYLHQKEELKKLPKIQKVADGIDWPVESVLADMEYEGITLDVGYLKPAILQPRPSLINCAACTQLLILLHNTEKLLS